MHRLNKALSALRRHPIIFALCVVCLVWGLARMMMPPLMRGVDFSHAYYDRNGKLMRVTLSADDKYRLYKPLNEIDDVLKRATILYEDKYFYYHPGINPIALVRATAGWARGAEHPAGASTITMQVARIKYNLDTKRIGGKLIQIAAAIYIDALYSKHDILEAYLNLAPYGGNIEGAYAASLIYFHRSPDALSAIESITLATIPQNPTRRGLNTTAGLENMRRMRGDLVRRWVAEYDTTADLETLAAMDLNVFGIRDLPFDAPHFTTQEAKHDSNYWRRRGATNSDVKTTLDMGLQTALQRRLTSEIARKKYLGIENAAAILLNYKTMEVLAHIGSADYFDRAIYGENDGVHARRSPGSTLKPLIYAQAADMGLIHGMTLMKDARINFGVYAPENSDNEFYGPVLARDALTHSRNIPAINLVRDIGVRNFYKLLSDVGVTGLRSPAHYGISIALGGAEVSMFELARIYATMANLGRVHDIRTRTTDEIDSGHQVLSREAFFLTLDMLGRQATPTRTIPFAKNTPQHINHYWKTGTSSSYRDAWTAGIFGDYVLIVWVGNFDGHPNNAFSGARTAAPLYFALADSATEYFAANGTPVANNNFLEPDMNIAEVEMCADVGGIAGPYCPKTTTAYFIPGKSPIDTASIYRAIPIDKKTGLRACTRDADSTYMAVYEFWDAEYLDMFERAGIMRNTPPPYLPGCKLNDIARNANAPVITAPADGTRIVITDDTDTTDVAFQAISNATYAKIFWFLDDDMIGTTASGAVLRTRVSMGEHTIRAADQMGGGASADFTIVR